MNNIANCKRCIKGQVLWLGDELACISCGWRPSAGPIADFPGVQPPDGVQDVSIQHGNQQR